MHLQLLPCFYFYSSLNRLFYSSHSVTRGIDTYEYQGYLNFIKKRRVLIRKKKQMADRNADLTSAIYNNSKLFDQVFYVFSRT